MSLPIKIMCVDDANKPQEIPQDKWITRGEVYTLIGVQPLLSSNSMGFELAEIKLGEECFPYHYFNPNRFIPIEETELDALEAELDEILYPKLA